MTKMLTSHWKWNHFEKRNTNLLFLFLLIYFIYHQPVFILSSKCWDKCYVFVCVLHMTLIMYLNVSWCLPIHIQFPKAALTDRATEERVCRLILLRQCGNSSRTVADDSQTSIRAYRRWGDLESIKTNRVRVN